MKRYVLESGMDTSITIEIDTTKITPDLAEQMNNFWSGAKELLRASAGDVYQAIARRTASRLLPRLVEGFDPEGSVRDLSCDEGFQPIADGGMTVIDHEIPDISPDAFEVREQEA